MSYASLEMVLFGFAVLLVWLLVITITTSNNKLEVQLCEKQIEKHTNRMNDIRHDLSAQERRWKEEHDTIKSLTAAIDNIRREVFLGDLNDDDSEDYIDDEIKDAEEEYEDEEAFDLAVEVGAFLHRGKWYKVTLDETGGGK